MLATADLFQSFSFKYSNITFYPKFY